MQKNISAVKIKAVSVFSAFKQTSGPEKHGWLNNTRCFPQIYSIRYFKHLKNTFIQNHDLDNNAQHISDLYAKKICRHMYGLDSTTQCLDAYFEGTLYHQSFSSLLKLFEVVVLMYR